MELLVEAALYKTITGEQEAGKQKLKDGLRHMRAAITSTECDISKLTKDFEAKLANVTLSKSSGETRGSKKLK